VSISSNFLFTNSTNCATLFAQSITKHDKEMLGFGQTLEFEQMHTTQKLNSGLYLIESLLSVPNAVRTTVEKIDCNVRRRDVSAACLRVLGWWMELLSGAIDHYTPRSDGEALRRCLHATPYVATEATTTSTTTHDISGWVGRSDD